MLRCEIGALYVRVVPGDGIYVCLATCEHGAVSGGYCGLCWRGYASFRGTAVL